MGVDTYSTFENFYLSMYKVNNFIKKSQLKLLQTTYLKEVDYLYQYYKGIKINEVSIKINMMSNQ